MDGLTEDNYDYFEYTSDNKTEDNSSGSLETFTSRPTRSLLKDTLVTINIIIAMLGLAGNAVVIWICVCKMRKTANTTWYLSLAISDFLFCACLPLEIVYAITSHWPFGLALCKLTSSALFLNMFSSVFLLVLISADRCLMITFPIWSRNHRTARKASGAAVLMWVLAAVLTVPSMVYRQTKVHGSVTQCYTEYVKESRHKAVVLTRFTCGFLVPFLVILFCCSVLSVKLRRLTIKSTKPYKVMASLILTFFICWLPYHTFVLYEFDFRKHSLEVVQTGLKIGGVLAATNSLINPILYVFIGKDFQRTLKKSFMSRIENAMAEDGRTGGQYPSRSKSMDMSPVT